MLLLQLVVIVILTLSAHCTTNSSYPQRTWPNAYWRSISQARYSMITLGVLMLTTSIGAICMYWLSKQSLLSFSLLRLSFCLYITYIGCRSLVSIQSNQRKITNRPVYGSITELVISMGITSFCIFDKDIAPSFLINIVIAYIVTKTILLTAKDNLLSYAKKIHFCDLKSVFGIVLVIMGIITSARSLPLLY